MEPCYRYWAWRVDISSELLLDLACWHCTIEYRQDCVDIYVPLSVDVLVQLKYPTLQRHPQFDRY
jgi:hypothetical protein